MDMSASDSAPGVSPPHPDAAPKRTRVLFSCGPCRASKLKCDRASPCGQCLKKGRTEGCVYAPRPEKKKPAKGMAARLRRLEGMVREMLDPEAPGAGAGELLRAHAAPGDEFAPCRGKVVQVGGGDRGTTYVGATHFMAMLDDIEDLKSYFDETTDLEEDDSPEASMEEDAPDLLLTMGVAPRPKHDILTYLPPKSVADRLIMRYFAAHSPSHHIVHRPTFVKQYNEFWHDPPNAPADWLALLFMVLAFGVFYSSFSAPHELASDSPVAASDRFRTYRTAAAWALVASKYTSPGRHTLAPLLLYAEADFLVNRSSQTKCYLLMAVCIRLMLKMGLHRDPSKLAGISPFEGEMRRRLWAMATQVELMVSFHMGLPGLVQGVEADTADPRNLLDEEFGEDSAGLPPGRPLSEYTTMSYPIFKSMICQVFGLVARQAHSLTAPAYSDVVKLDSLLEERWGEIPHFMKVKPLDDCIVDPPHQVIQRFGISSLYQKGRCVLHRRYLMETPPRPEHEYSRRACLDAALALLGYQKDIYQATQPGMMLGANRWIVTSLAMHDYLLASMIVYLAIQHRYYSEAAEGRNGLPGRRELIGVLKRSKEIWSATAADAPELRKAPEVVETMLNKIAAMPQQCAREAVPGTGAAAGSADGATIAHLHNLRIEEPASLVVRPVMSPQDCPMPPLRSGLVPDPAPGTGAKAASWLADTSTDADWNSFEDVLSTDTYTDPSVAQWVNADTFSHMDFVAANFWEPAQGSIRGAAPEG